ncbi:hypothetical protein HDU97_003922 [Phlyctochytrium planicorne]|nr:hypothetical protein HDU97_003922 [Phlyctochytrium planicorne]
MEKPGPNDPTESPKHEYRNALDLEDLSDESSERPRPLQFQSLFSKSVTLPPPTSASTPFQSIMSSVHHASSSLKAAAMDINPKLRSFYEAIVHKSEKIKSDVRHGGGEERERQEETEQATSGDEVTEDAVKSGGESSDEEDAGPEFLDQVKGGIRPLGETPEPEEYIEPSRSYPRRFSLNAPGDGLPIGISASSYPSTMTISVKKVELAGKHKVVYVRLVFRGKRLYPINPEDEENADKYSAALTYHALLFDTLKVDVYERSFLVNTHLLSAHVGRARVKIRSLSNLRESTIETFPLFHRKLKPGENPVLLGFITLAFDFSYDSPPIEEEAAAEPVYLSPELETPIDLPTIVLEEKLEEEAGVVEADDSSSLAPDDAVSLAPDDSISVMGDLGDPDLGSNFGSQVGSRAEGEKMVFEFMQHFRNATRETQDDFYTYYSTTMRGKMETPSGLSSASITHDPTLTTNIFPSDKPGVTRTSTLSSTFRFESSGGWFKPPSVIPKKTMETIKEMSNLAAAFFNQGWRISKMEFVWSLILVSRWQIHALDPMKTALPDADQQKRTHTIKRSKSLSDVETRIGSSSAASISRVLTSKDGANFAPDIVDDSELIRSAIHFMRFAEVTYGSVPSLFEVGKAYMRDFLGSKADRWNALSHMGIPSSDILEWEFSTSFETIFKPKYFVCWDGSTESIVVCVRGTVNIHDVVTDLCAEYDPYRTGHLHRGIYRCARWMIDNLLPRLHRYIIERRASSLNIVGHSLGAAIGSIFAMIVRDTGFLQKVEKELQASVRSASYLPELNYEEGRLGYGSMIDLRETIIKGAELLRSNKMTDKEKFDALSAFSERLRAENVHPKIYVPGQLYHIRKVAIQVLRKPSFDFSDSRPTSPISDPPTEHTPIEMSPTPSDDETSPTRKLAAPAVVLPSSSPNVANSINEFVTNLRTRTSSYFTTTISSGSPSGSHTPSSSGPQVRRQSSLWKLRDTEADDNTHSESEVVSSKVSDVGSTGSTLAPTSNVMPSFSAFLSKKTNDATSREILVDSTVKPVPSTAARDSPKPPLPASKEATSLAPTTPTPAPSIINSFFGGSSTTGSSQQSAAKTLKPPEGSKYVLERVVDRTRFESIRVQNQMIGDHFPVKYLTSLKKTEKN